MLKHYRLDGKVVVQCADLMEWAEWFKTANRHVADETICGIRISTIFLGLNQNLSLAGLQGKADPLLFETMTFLADGTPVEQWRYFTWAEAEEGHKKLVEIVKAQAADAEFLTKDALRELMRKVKT